MTIRCLAIGLLVCTPLCIAAQAPPKWRLVEEWRKGGEAEGAYSFDNVMDLKSLPGGRIVMLDRKGLKLHIYDSTGAIVRSFSGRGAGPGEMRSPMGIAVAHNGTIVINDPNNARFSVFAPNGDYVRSISILRQPRMMFNMQWEASFDRAGRLIASVGIRPVAPDPNVPPSWSPFADSTLVTERWSTDFSKSDSAALCGAPLPIHRSTTHYRTVRSGSVVLEDGVSRGVSVGWMEIPLTEQRPAYARDLDGFEWAPREFGSAELVRRESGKCGAIIARITLRGSRAAIPAAHRDDVIKRANVAPEFRDRVPRSYPWFHSLRVDDRNRLWVLRDVDGGKRFDLFTSTGQPIAELAVPPGMVVDASPLPALVVLAHGRVYGFVKDADDVRYLVAWRIVR